MLPHYFACRTGPESWRALDEPELVVRVLDDAPAELRDKHRRAVSNALLSFVRDWPLFAGWADDGEPLRQRLLAEVGRAVEGAPLPSRAEAEALRAVLEERIRHAVDHPPAALARALRKGARRSAVDGRVVPDPQSGAALAALTAALHAALAPLVVLERDPAVGVAHLRGCIEGRLGRLSGWRPALCDRLREAIGEPVWCSMEVTR